MRLTSFTDFGLRVLVRLAGQPDRRLNTETLAREFAISRHHLHKVVQELAASGFIATHRGAGGGISLSRPAAEIRLGAVVRALEREQALVECFRAAGNECRLTPVCGLRGPLGQAREAFLATLDRTSLAECAYGGPLPVASASAGGVDDISAA